MAEVPRWFTVMSFALFGLLFGSFANVVIWRLPRSESLSSPGSHCPVCEAPIRWYDNVPVVSWLVLGGRCRDCRTPIAVRYPLVEALSSILFAVAALTWDPVIRAVTGAAFFWFLLVLSAIDLDTLRLPNPLVAALGLVGALGLAAGLITGTPVAPLVARATDAMHPAVSAALGAAIGAGVSGGIALLYRLVRGARGLGMGDIKFLGVLGVFLGPLVLLALFIGSLLGSLAGLFTSRGEDGSRARIPFGPWLAVGAFVTALAGRGLLAWYLQLTGIA